MPSERGAGDVIFVSSDGYMLEGPRSTVVIATSTDGVLPSPRRRGIRSCAGTTQQALFASPRNKGYALRRTARCGPRIWLTPKVSG